MEKGELAVLSVPACDFGYRDSIFKTSEGKKYIITAVTFKLSLEASPQTTYKDLALAFPHGSLPTLADIRKEIIAIRSEKFPDWNTVGTAGSFFKNPIVSPQKAEELRVVYPALPLYPTETGEVKISLGFVLDKILARKGYTEGKVGLFEKQALVLIAQRGAAYSEVKSFAEKIIAQVKEKIGVTVEMEVTEIL
jgi:UDP-N-acetylmuramate dehydrogenase